MGQARWNRAEELFGDWLAVRVGVSEIVWWRHAIGAEAISERPQYIICFHSSGGGGVSKRSNCLITIEVSCQGRHNCG